MGNEDSMEREKALCSTSSNTKNIAALGNLSNA